MRRPTVAKSDLCEISLSPAPPLRPTASVEPFEYAVITTLPYNSEYKLAEVRWTHTANPSWQKKSKNCGSNRL
jgi:hypothetical protein